MIDVNATLFIQMANFYIAYLLCRYILFKPACEVIHQENAQQLKLKSMTSRLRDLIKHKRQAQADVWATCRSYYKKHIPSIAKEVKHDQGDQIIEHIYKPISQKEIDEIVRRDTDRLVALLGSKYD